MDQPTIHMIRTGVKCCEPFVAIRISAYQLSAFARLTVSVTRWWVGRDNAALTELA